MSLSLIQKDKLSQPYRCLIHGTEGVGKSTFASLAPKPVFVPTEDGLGQITVDHFPVCQDYGDVLLYLQSLIVEDHAYQTVVIDSVDWLERLAARCVVEDYNKQANAKSVSTLLEIPYGGGVSRLIPLFEKVIGRLDTLRTKRRMNVVLIAHTKLEKVEDPCGSSYDQYSPRLDKRINGIVKEWVDVIGFASQKIRREKIDEGFNRERTVAAAANLVCGNRVLILEPSPAIVAKSRYTLPGEMPLDGKKFFTELGRLIHEGVRHSGRPVTDDKTPVTAKKTNTTPETETPKPEVTKQDIMESLLLIYGSEEKIPKTDIANFYRVQTFNDLTLEQLQDLLQKKQRAIKNKQTQTQNQTQVKNQDQTQTQQTDSNDLTQQYDHLIKTLAQLTRKTPEHITETVLKQYKSESLEHIPLERLQDLLTKTRNKFEKKS